MLHLHQKQILMRQATPTCYKYHLPNTINKANVYPLLTVNTGHNSETSRRKWTAKLCSPSIGQWKGLMPVCVKKWPFRHSGHEKCLSHWSHLNLHKFRCLTLWHFSLLAIVNAQLQPCEKKCSWTPSCSPLNTAVNSQVHSCKYDQLLMLQAPKLLSLNNNCNFFVFCFFCLLLCCNYWLPKKGTWPKTVAFGPSSSLNFKMQ